MGGKILSNLKIDEPNSQDGQFTLAVAEKKKWICAWRFHGSVGVVIRIFR